MKRLITILCLLLCLTSCTKEDTRTISIDNDEITSIYIDDLAQFNPRRAIIEDEETIKTICDLFEAAEAIDNNNSFDIDELYLLNFFIDNHSSSYEIYLADGNYYINDRDNDTLYSTDKGTFDYIKSLVFSD